MYRIVFVFNLILLPLAGCSRMATPPPAAPPPPKVTVSHPIQTAVQEYHEFNGQIEATESVEIRARVRGYLTQIHVPEGQEVKTGDFLYEIDPRPYEADVRRLEADVSRAEAQLELTQADERRSKSLRASGAVTQEELETRAASRKQAEAAVLQARAAVDVAKLDLGYTHIKAPIDGRVSRTLVTVGNLIGYNDPTLLTTITKMDPIYVYFETNERAFLDYQQRIRESGAPMASQKTLAVEVQLANEQDYPHHGVLDFRENRVDAGTGTMMLRGVLPNPDRIMAPGMFARVRVPIGVPAQQLLLPIAVVQSDQRGNFVFTVQADDTVSVRTVILGVRQGNLVAIKNGINAKDRVVINGIQKARPNAKVAPQEQSLASIEASATSRQR